MKQASMRSWIVGAVAGACLSVAIASWWAQPAGAQAETVTGRVVCLVCYTRNKANTGHDHDDGRMCARACIRWEGNPAALVTSEGKVYQFSGGVIANNNEKISQYLAETVTVKGRIYDKEGMPMIDTDEVLRVAGAAK
jgi:hypothetical protein